MFNRCRGLNASSENAIVRNYYILKPIFKRGIFFREHDSLKNSAHVLENFNPTPRIYLVQICIVSCKLVINNGHEADYAIRIRENMWNTLSAHPFRIDMFPRTFERSEISPDHVHGGLAIIVSFCAIILYRLESVTAVGPLLGLKPYRQTRRFVRCNAMTTAVTALLLYIII
jgi:hypothetical protein